MSVAAVYDTLAAVKRLQGRGFDSEQAEGIVAEVARHSIESLATKADIREVRLAIDGVATKADIREMQLAIEAQGREMQVATEGLRREMGVFRWALGLVAAGLLAILVLLIRQGGLV